jgi:hypothetical protein
MYPLVWLSGTFFFRSVLVEWGRFVAIVMSVGEEMLQVRLVFSNISVRLSIPLRCSARHIGENDS